MRAPRPARQGCRQLATGFWRGGTAGRAWWLTGLLLASLLTNVGVQYGINLWTGAFFDSLERRDAGAFSGLVAAFAGLAAASVVLGAAQMVCRVRLQVEWRQWVSRALVRRWLEERRFYRLGASAPDVDAPEFRIAEDARVATEAAVDLAHGFLGALVTAAVFLTALWQLGGSRVVAGIVVPGFLVWAALAYAGALVMATWALGPPLVARTRTRNAAEAGLRFDMARVRENAESIALLGGGEGEEARLHLTLRGVAAACRAVMRQQAKVTVVTAANWVAAPVLPLLLMAPGFLVGGSSLGDLVQAATAFVQVQAALTWFVDNTPRIGEWLASVGRVTALSRAMEGLDEGTPEGGILVGRSPDDCLRLVGVGVIQQDGLTVIDGADAVFAPGERVLLTGASGIGKSMLVRAVAGLWRWGTGQVLVPVGARVAFLPQRPYMPLGTFREVLRYPRRPGEGSAADDDAAVRAAMERCELAHLVSRLDAVERWDKVLSGGEQQRVAIARLLLALPDIVIMDEATSALDAGCQDRMMRLFDAELRGTTLISVGHRPELAAYHTRQLSLLRTARGVHISEDRASRATNRRARG